MEVARLDGKHLYLLSHLPGPKVDPSAKTCCPAQMLQGRIIYNFLKTPTYPQYLKRD